MLNASYDTNAASNSYFNIWKSHTFGVVFIIEYVLLNVIIFSDLYIQKQKYICIVLGDLYCPSQIHLFPGRKEYLSNRLFHLLSHGKISSHMIHLNTVSDILFHGERYKNQTRVKFSNGIIRIDKKGIYFDILRNRVCL